MFSVQINSSEFDAVLERIVGTKTTQLNELVKDVSEILTGTLKTEAPVSASVGTSAGVGGRLRESLVFQTGYLGATLEGVGYARYVIAGTRPHWIQHRVARALVFYWERMGARVVFSKVRHPGTKPNDFRRRGLDLAISTGQVDEAISRFWSALGGGGAA